MLLFSSPTCLLCPPCRIPCSLLCGRRKLGRWLNPWQQWADSSSRGTCGGASTSEDQGQRQGRYVLLLICSKFAYKFSFGWVMGMPRCWWEVFDGSGGFLLMDIPNLELAARIIIFVFAVARLWLSLLVFKAWNSGWNQCKHSFKFMFSVSGFLFAIFLDVWLAACYFLICLACCLSAWHVIFLEKTRWIFQYNLILLIAQSVLIYLVLDSGWSSPFYMLQT